MIATAYSNMGKYAEVQDWLAKALQKDYKYAAGEIQTQRGLERQIAYLLADSYDNNKEYEKAAKALQSYANNATEGERNDIQNDLDELKVKSVVQKQLDSFKVLANVALKMDKLETVKNLIRILPASLLDEVEVVRLKRALGMNKEWGKESVVIFAGIGLEEWDQDSTDKGGIGGSETAVIEMAKRWAEAGYEVTVYGAVKETKVFGNVVYVPVQEISWADRFNIFISWRNPVVVKGVDIWAKKLYIWLHDVPNPKHYTLDVINKVDKIIVLSNYHRGLLPSVPDDKIYISRNGIDIDAINAVVANAPDRNMRRMVFTSSPDRGLETLLDMLPDIKKKVGDIELVWAYGWDNFDKIRFDADGLKWKSDMQAKMRKLGVVEAGRLNKHGLYKLLCSSGYWVYPTRFPEINCISVQEAQACGCYPISSGFAALAETQKIGIVEMDNEVFKRKLIGLLNKPVEVPVRDWGKLFGWDGVAKQWCKDLFYGETIEKPMPLVSVICTTIRPAMFRVLKDQMDKQTYKNIELIVVDGRYDERKDRVAQYFSKVKYPVLHLPDPDRDKTKYPYGICHACNAALYAANGELLVFLQDFIEIEADAIERFVDLYRLHPEMIYTGVDERWGFKCEVKDTNDAIDIFKFKDYELTDKQYVSKRIRIGGAIRKSVEPMEWELNWAAAPKAALLSVGGWDNDWDKAFGYDNTEIALRFIYNGGMILVDENNLAKALSHWDMWKHDEAGVPDRTKKTNDQRYVVYKRYLAETYDVNVVMDFKIPNYPDDINILIKRFKK